MMNSERVLTRFCSRLHRDETDPLGSIVMVDQIGLGELQVRTARGPIVLKASDNFEIITAHRKNFHVEGRELTDEFYEQFVTYLREEISARRDRD